MKTKTHSKKPIISILIGSGFSIPAGIPGVKEINKRLSKIDESEIIIHSQMSAGFLNGQTDNNRLHRNDERLFVQEFIKFYNSLQSVESFHYETFYDFYWDYRRGIANKDLIDRFIIKFNNDQFPTQEPTISASQRIDDFNRTFNQLIAQLIQKSWLYEDISYLDFPPYDYFIRFLRHLLFGCDIKVHSLNHDLLFEYIGTKHADLWEFFSDGFELAGSPFYGHAECVFNPNTEHKVKKGYFVKLPRYTGKYNTPLCLYKLHGNIATHIVYPDHENSPIRIKRTYGIGQYYQELYNSSKGEYELKHLWDMVQPDFLTGTTEKTRHYSNDPFYKEMFNCFETNLQMSDFLIVIGYGFQDTGINNFIEDNYLSKGKAMAYIDPNKPENEILIKYPSTHIQKSITEVSIQEYNNLTPNWIIEQCDEAKNK
ncbi:MAG: hypothetical protein CVU05_14240 [Bacteroidetes bacterium HGW-Bacteroidetes-21]|nr:MAG: hypothetical protein CVU05_14240 [Bacteroidetes bacterium HGW-Bacteroidetes-21]